MTRRLSQRLRLQLERAVYSGMEKVGRGLEKDLERAYAPFGRLAKAWAHKTYPQRAKASFSASTMVYARGGIGTRKALEAHGTGVVVRSAHGAFLAVPTENAPKRGQNRKRISPANWPEHRFGPLRFVYRRPPLPSLLVVDDVRASFSRKTGKLRGFKRASKTALRTGRGLTTVVMFWLYPRVVLRKRVPLRETVERWRKRAPRLVAAEIAKAARGRRR